MKNRLIVKGKTNLERDSHTKAILNRDDIAYQNARARKRLKKQQADTITDLIKRIESLEKQVKALKKLDK